MCRQSQRRAERGLNAIGRSRQVEESAPVRSDFDGNWGFLKVHEATGAGAPILMLVRKFKKASHRRCGIYLCFRNLVEGFSET
jgi:hypothetical protein